MGCSGKQPDTQSQPGQHSSDTTIAAMSKNADSFEHQTTSVGQLVYVPVYSHISQQDRQKTFNLTATLCIRNTDPYRSFTITEVSYFDSQGNLVEQYLDNPRFINPLSSTSFVVEESDVRANLL